jgi:phosphatidylglycerophosphatase A
MDPLADKVLSSAALLAFAWLGLVDTWLVWIVIIRDFLITGLRTTAEYYDRPIVTSKSAQAKTFGQFVVIYYILILYVARSVPAVTERFGDLIDSLMHPQVLFGMMLVVTLTTVGTGAAYIWDNRKFIREFVSLHPLSDPENPASGAVPLLPRMIASVGFLGYLPWATGTFGSLAGLAVYMIPGVEYPAVLAGLIVAGLAAGIPSAAAVARVEGNRLTRSAEAAKETFQKNSHTSPDPSSVVIDEAVGMWVTLLFLPRAIPVALAGFVLFRIFDILKPQPARFIERYPRGWGIMLDDVVAGIYANIVLQLGLLALRQVAPGLI